MPLKALQVKVPTAVCWQEVIAIFSLRSLCSLALKRIREE